MPSLKQPHPDVGDVRMKCRGKRKTAFFIAMTCTFAALALYTISLGCCVVISRGIGHALKEGSRVIILDPPGDQEPYVHVRDHHQYDDLIDRKLIELSDIAGVPEGWVQPEHAGETLRYTGVRRTEEDQLNGYIGDLFDTDDLTSSFDDDGVSHPDVENTGTSIARTSKGGSRKLPQALIIGVKKSGTRALLEFLRIHPDVRAPGPEAHFFDKHYHRGLEWYRKQMPSTIPGQITMEKTPSYFVTKGVPARVYNMSQDVKCLVVVRDPVTRAISDWTQAASKRSDIRPFEEMAFIDNFTGLVDTSWGAVRIGVYAKHLERWLRYFPLEQIHFVNGEKLVTEPATELDRVQDFLGLKRVINDKHFYFNSTKGFPCLKKPEGSGNPHCLGKTKGRPHPEVNPRVIKRLQDFFRPFNAKFYQMTGIDFGWD